MNPEQVALVAYASGMHPASARLVVLDAVAFDDDGSPLEDLHLIFNPGTTAAGPTHMHGLTSAQISQAPRFATTLKKLDRFLDGRLLVTHKAPSTWGFIVAEARRAMNAAARANRSRNRDRGRRRQRVGHVPTPSALVDTMATARRAGLHLPDTRLAAVAAHYGIDAPDPRASVERALRPEAEVAREQTLLLIQLYLAQRERGAVVSCEPGDVRADRFGLQRSHVRVDALEVPRTIDNPGIYDPATGLRPGMEVVIAPEITHDPDEIIEECLIHQLAYSEKLTRASSLVVCNARENLTGKAMHARRKGIPLMTDADFLSAARALG